MPQVVDSNNLLEFTRTGNAPKFEQPKPEAATPATTTPESQAPKTPETPPRGPDGKFTKPAEGDKTTTATPSTDIDVDDDERDLSETVRRKIAKKHRAQKEAEERERRETLRAIAAEQRAEQAERRLRESEKSGSAPAKESKEPKPEDFATVAEYTDALVSYRVEQRLNDEKAKSAREADEQAKAKRQREYAKRLAQTKAKHDDYDEVLGSIAGTDLEQVPNDVIEYIQESDSGPELIYHLAKNPDVLDRLRALSPRRFIAELGKLEAKFEADTEAQKTTPLSEAAKPSQVPLKVVSKAPAPIAPLDTAGVAPVAKKPEDMSVAELREHRRQQDAEKRASGRS